MGDTRQANPDDLDHLAGLMESEDGSSGAAAELADLFTRASALDASSEMSPLRPLQTWLSETAAELRSNARTLRGGDALDLYTFGSEMRGTVMPVIYGTAGLWSWLRHGELPGIPAGRAAMYMADYAFTGERPANLMGRVATRGLSPWMAGLLGGSHEAAAYGAYMRNGAWFIPTAQQANLLRVGYGSYTSALASGSSRLSSFTSALGTTGRAAGLLRGAGILGSGFSTITGVVDLVQQGNPVEAFQRDPSGYTVDVTGTAFNASLTAALVCPNPVTVGAAVGTGIAYGASLIWDNWDTITDPQTYINAANAIVDAGEAVVDAVVDVGSDIVEGIGDFVGSLF
ncbi:hypothetical protein [Streptomyces sp. 7-21]|jgi:hypothetical protein|uniref:hypothetical protein n=1 Tax=Streptomyces sp. 7-21 TaxID=2802283 RepID=UPI00191E8570|nr:hypothetical protein [Streptomyces sp. 7-21]MBL1065809.1 hypothetical protein [Streptomyces sp. 7-21]